MHDKSEYKVTIPEDMVDRTLLSTPIIEVVNNGTSVASLKELETLYICNIQVHHRRDIASVCHL